MSVRAVLHLRLFPLQRKKKAAELSSGLIRSTEVYR
jgi:hypothetical protein